MIHPLPIHAQSFEHYGDPLMEKYPLQLSGFHYKARTHSTYGNVDVLKAANPQEVWMNPIDAEPRNIKIFNDRGEVRINVKITPVLFQGLWH